MSDNGIRRAPLGGASARIGHGAGNIPGQTGLAIALRAV
jgi:hypothetical protein